MEIAVISIRRTPGGYMVRIRCDVPAVFIADNIGYDRRRGIIPDRTGVIAYLEKMWWMAAV